MVLLLISIACFIYSIFAFNQRGPLLTTQYFGSKEDYEKAKTKSMYRSVARSYFFLSLIFLVSALGYITNYENSKMVLMLLLLAFIIYTFVDMAINPYKKDK